MIIPYNELSEVALTGLIEEFVTREGTDYDGVHVDLEKKVAKVMKQLARGKVVVVFDPVEQRANLVVADSLKAQQEANSQEESSSTHYEPDPDPDPYGDF